MKKLHALLLLLALLTLTAVGAQAERTITIPAGTTKIGTEAFRGDKAITQVVIPASVTNIGNYAFAETGLTWIDLTGKVAFIGPSAFKGCPAELTALVVRGSYADTYCKEKGINRVYLEKLASGATDLSKLSQSEINRLLSSTDWAPTGSVYVTEPKLTAPYRPGKLKDEPLNKTLARLNALRRIAGLHSVVLNQEKCDQAQYGAVLIAVSQYSHYPPQPADMSDDFFEIGAMVARSSNLYKGRAFVGAIDGYMDDSDSTNIDRLGHRRWQLNPRMADVGFGHAVKKEVFTFDDGYSYSFDWDYFAEMVFSSSAQCSYHYVGWPASGNFPASQFASHVAWSVTMNPSEYNVPSTGISVTLTRAADKKTWHFSRDAADGYFNVDLAGYGVSNCIVFRPSDIVEYSGKFTVAIDGLTTRSGEAVRLMYDVNFF